MKNVSLTLSYIERSDGMVKTYHKGVQIDLPDPFSSHRWHDEVGESFTKKAERESKEHQRFLLDAADQIKKAAESLPADDVSYDASATRRYIDSLKVRR